MPEYGSVTQRIEFDAGHRLPHHKSKCYNVHGHRYALEATCVGIVDDGGMVIDFYDLEQAMLETVFAQWDHAFLCWENDTLMRAALKLLDDSRVKPQKYHLLPFPPTIEYLAQHAFTMIRERVPALVSVKLFETPTCSTVYPVEKRHD